MKELVTFLKTNRFFIYFLFVICVVVYFHILFNDFVSIDDFAGYVNNQSLDNFMDNARKLALYPILYSFFKITVGDSPTILHFYSIILHFINTVLVLLLVNQIFGKKTAVISSILFAVYPINSEAVSWYGAMSYLINAIFIFTTLIFYAQYKKTHGIKYYITSVITFIFCLAITRSVWLLVIPFLIGVMEVYIFEKKISLKSITRICAFFIPGLVFFFLINALGYRTSDLQNYGFDYTKATPWLSRLAYTFYTGTKLLVFPKYLSIFHENEIISRQLYRFMVFTTFAILTTILVLIKKYRAVAGLLMLIIVSIAPTLSPIQVAFFIAERYLYVGSAFFIILLAILFLKLETRTKIKNLSIILTVVLCVIYSVRTFYRTQDWENSRILWEATAKIEYNDPRVYNNLGDAYANENNYEASIRAFVYAIKLQPNFAAAFHNLGNVYLKTGQYQLAKGYYAKALELDPNYNEAPAARNNLEILRKY